MPLDTTCVLAPTAYALCPPLRMPDLVFYPPLGIRPDGFHGPKLGTVCGRLEILPTIWRTEVFRCAIQYKCAATMHTSTRRKRAPPSASEVPPAKFHNRELGRTRRKSERCVAASSPKFCRLPTDACALEPSACFLFRFPTENAETKRALGLGSFRCALASRVGGCFPGVCARGAF